MLVRQSGRDQLREDLGSFHAPMDI